MPTQNSGKLPEKPIPLRVIFILNALMMFLPFLFYYVFTTKDITVGDIDPKWMIYTGIAYIISFIALAYCILKRNYAGLRIIILLNILIAIPAGAYIGIGVAIISFVLTYNKKVKAYFLVD